MKLADLGGVGAELVLAGGVLGGDLDGDLDGELVSLFTANFGSDMTNTLGSPRPLG